jgi:hypothetical protein
MTAKFHTDPPGHPLNVPQTEEETIALLTASLTIVKARKAKRDEWSCPCCGTPTDSSYCEACSAFECGERDWNDPNIGTCLVPKHVAVWRTRHAAHYAGGGGHDLLTLEVTVPASKEAGTAMFDKRGVPRVEGLPAGFEYHSGHGEPGGTQRWRFVRTAPLSEGTCALCREVTR